MSDYDPWAPVYDDWSSEMTDDVPYDIDLVREADGPVVELTVGTGRVAIPAARETGKRVVGIDSSPAMLEEQAALIYVPFRSLLHLRGWHEKRRVFERVAASLRPGGRFAFNAFAFSHGVAARLDGEEQRRAGIVTVNRYAPADNRIDVIRDDGAEIHLWWATRSEWHGLIDVAGLELETEYGWFDRRPLTDDSPELVFVARKRA